MAAPRPKKKARPAKDLKQGDIRSQYTFKNESPQQSARDLKASDLRQKYAEGPKQSRPAADLKAGDSRASYLKKAKAKPYQPAPRAPKYAKPIGPQRPASAGSVAAKTTAGSVVRKTLGRAIGAVGAIVDPSFMSYKTDGQAGPGSDKPVQSLKKKYAQPIGPERPKIGSRRVYTSPVGPFKPTGGGPERRQGSSSPSMGVKRSDFYFGDIPSYKSTTQKTAVVTKPKVKPKVKPKAETGKGAEKKVKFKGNWVGAAPTEMQARGGARIKRPNLLSWMKNRRKK